MQLRNITAIGLFVILCQGAYAQTPATGEPEPSGRETPTEGIVAGADESAAPSRQDQLTEILESIQAAESERDQIRKRLKAATAEVDVKELEADVKRLTQRLEELNTAFEETATGGATVEKLEQQLEPKAIDWKQEIEDIIRPLLQEVKRMTERPRTIERLRSEQELYQDRLKTADRAIGRIRKALDQIDSPAVNKSLKTLLQEWQSHRADADSGLQRVDGQLQRLLAPSEDEAPRVVAAVQEFFAGRGLSLLLAAAGFILTYAALAALGRLAGRALSRRDETKARSFAKAGGILFRLASFLAAVFIAMAVLYVRGDWLILGLLILLLFALVLALRNSVPRYIQQIRIILNMGGVREGERVVYRGVPWRIKSLNIYSTLHNPLLRGGTIRVSIEEMAPLQSRQFVKDEPWFPSSEDDFVILEGDIFGKVLLQTPEVVQLQVIGSTKTFAVGDYLGKQPRNLSTAGFAVPITIGLDYRHQADILTTIVDQMRAHLSERLDTQVYHPYLKDLIVDFNEAAGSSLNLIIVAVFNGDAAEHYWSIRRFLQRCAVEACNRYGWSIPFEQLTVHLQENHKPVVSGSSQALADQGV
jgi:predicted  nucleic acid-binding Zn-ribbon protein